MIRPQPCSWFEIVIGKDDAFITLESLAAAGCAEVEWHETQAPGYAMPPDLLKEFGALARKYRPYWPRLTTAHRAERRAPAQALADGIRVARTWAAQADEVVRILQVAEAEAAELDLAAEALRELAESRIDFAALAQASNGITAALFALPPRVDIDVPPDTLARFATTANERLLLALGAPEAIEAIAGAVTEVNGRRARFPDWLQPSAKANLALVEDKRTEAQASIARLRKQMAALNEQHGLARALGDIALATWCFEHGGAIEQGDVFARITGWTADRARLLQALEACDARAIATFPRPPHGVRPPLVLRNPWWAQPFEIFTRMVGMPGTSGADPSALLALAVPVIFGYMFGDVGHGMVLALAGWLLRDRMPVLRLLVPGGIAAAIFGVVFGSVLCREDIINASWLHPIEHPLPVLLVPIVGGALLLMLGLLLGALEAWWERRLAVWLREDAPVLLTYGGALAAFMTPLGGWIAAAGIAWAVVAAIIEKPAPAAAFGALGELLERTVQVLINTLSFARVGAFALAHAGLCAAVIALADAGGNIVVYGLIFVLGNVLILVVEGLVVSIQTTRLVLFEFFTRFFRPEGREFRPLAAPPVILDL